VAIERLLMSLTSRQCDSEKIEDLVDAILNAAVSKVRLEQAPLTVDAAQTDSDKAVRSVADVRRETLREARAELMKLRRRWTAYVGKEDVRPADAWHAGVCDSVDVIDQLLEAPILERAP
jgi:hypothetical protein